MKHNEVCPSCWCPRDVRIAYMIAVLQVQKHGAEKVLSLFCDGCKSKIDALSSEAK